MNWIVALVVIVILLIGWGVWKKIKIDDEPNENDNDINGPFPPFGLGGVA